MGRGAGRRGERRREVGGEARRAQGPPPAPRPSSPWQRRRFPSVSHPSKNGGQLSADHFSRLKKGPCDSAPSFGSRPKTSHTADGAARGAPGRSAGRTEGAGAAGRAGRPRAGASGAGGLSNGPEPRGAVSEGDDQRSGHRPRGSFPGGPRPGARQGARGPGGARGRLVSLFAFVPPPAARRLPSSARGPRGTSAGGPVCLQVRRRRAPRQHAVPGRGEPHANPGAAGLYSWVQGRHPGALAAPTPSPAARPARMPWRPRVQITVAAPCSSRRSQPRPQRDGHPQPSPCPPSPLEVRNWDRAPHRHLPLRTRGERCSLQRQRKKFKTENGCPHPPQGERRGSERPGH